MKRVIHALLLTAASITYLSHATDNFKITIQAKWKELGCKNNQCFNLDGKWILVGSFTFIRRSKDPIALETIYLNWNGPKLDNLSGSLYRKTVGKEFFAIEENLVCDSIWNEKKQMLIFDFDKKENLGPSTVFYLVLTVPEEIESILTKGFFSLESHGLPYHFKHCAQQERLVLAIDDGDSRNIAH